MRDGLRAAVFRYLGDIASHGKFFVSDFGYANVLLSEIILHGLHKAYM